jgi:hypothetical protein
MRVHTLYSFDDDDGPSLQQRHILDLESFLKIHEEPGERLDQKATAHTEAQKADPHYRGRRAITRLRSGSFMREDVDALFPYVGMMVSRAQAKLKLLIDESQNEHIQASPHSRRAYEGQIDAIRSTIERIQAIERNMRLDIYEAMETATPADRHP